MCKIVIRIIWAGILNPTDYNTELELSNLNRPPRCPKCGIADSLHSHGCYYRDIRCVKNGLLLVVQVKILRFFCKVCRKTCSFLPECIPPRRWYLWKTQQFVIQKYLNGCSMREINTETSIPISTCKRWCKWLLTKYNSYALVLKNIAGNLGDALRDTAGKFKQFWQRCFDHISLDRAMLLCHQAGVDTP